MTHLARISLLLAALLAGGTIADSQASASPAATAQASGGCSGVTLTPSSRTIRRGGKVLLSGTTCGSTSGRAGAAVQVRQLKGKAKWATIGKAVADGEGAFSFCVRVTAPMGSRVARLRATGPAGTAAATVRVGSKGPSGCSGAPGGDTGDSGDSGDDTYKPPPPEVGDPNCPLSHPGSAIDMTLPSACSKIFSDTVSDPNPIPSWGRLDCASSSRHQVVNSGADPHKTAVGSPQPDSSFRRMTAVDGDDVWGERCEAGLNDQSGPTALYHEGQRRVTFASIRLPDSSPVGNPNWRTVLQMKQAQPYYNPAGASMFELQVRDNTWLVVSDWNDVWTTPAQQNTWTRFAFDVVYSQDPSVGSIKIYVDLNGDGDAGDANEQSPRINRQTLKPEVAGGSSPVPVGASIPSHLRTGIYQNSNYSCPSGCSVDVDNVEVFKP